MYGHITDWVIGGYVGPSVWSYWCFYIGAQHSGLLCVPTPDPLNTSQHNTSANNTSAKHGRWTMHDTPEGSTVYYTVQHGMELDKGGGGKAASAPPTTPIITARAWFMFMLYIHLLVMRKHPLLSSDEEEFTIASHIYVHKCHRIFIQFLQTYNMAYRTLLRYQILTWVWGAAGIPLSTKMLDCKPYENLSKCIEYT